MSSDVEKLRVALVRIIGDLGQRIADLETRLALVEEGTRQLPAINHRLALVNEIDRSFSNDELDDLAFDVGINGGGLVGRSKGQRIRDLVLQCERKLITNLLIERCHQLRPKSRWPDV